MSARRLLLIDADQDFYRILHEQVGPYGFEIYQIGVDLDALDKAQDIAPELLFIAVEEPDKLGYTLCSKARRSTSIDIPIVLTTGTVPPAGFNNHRKLRGRADEYIDKRTMSTEELINKVDALIGLGAPSVDGVEFDADFDVSEDAFADEDDKTRIAPPQVLLEASAASPASDTGVDGPAGAKFSPFEEATDDIGFDDDDDVKTSASLPAFRSAVIATEHGVAPPPPGGQPDKSNGGIPELIESTLAADGGHATGSGPRPQPGGGLDLGLEQVAEMASEEKSGLHERRDLRRLHELERENQKLKTELDKARQTSDPGTSAFSREREFLNLREVINQKEKEIIALRDEVGAKERQILDGREQIRDLQRSRTDLESSILEFEQKLLHLNERIAQLEGEKKSAADRIGGLEQELSELEQRRAREAAQAQQDARAAADALAEQQAQSARKLADLEQAHEAALAERDRSHEADKQTALSEQTGEYEEQLATLREEHERALQDREAAHEAALASARSEAEAEEERALAEADAAHRRELESLTARHEEAQNALVAQHDSERQALESEQAEELARLQEEKQEALNALEGKATAELAAVRAEHQQAVERAAAEAQEREDRLEREHAVVVAELETDRDQLENQLSSARDKIASLDDELEQAHQVILSHEHTIEEHVESLAARDEQISALEQDVEELDEQNAGYQEQILEAFKKIKSDEATVNRAKKALAIALTLLDESISGIEVSGEDSADRAR